MSPLAEALARSPELFPHSFDFPSDSLTLLHLTEQEYAQASFLDGRLASGMQRRTAFPEVSRAVGEAALPEKCDFIFHIGHVGSTLLSRLLGGHPRVFSLREPAVLRTMAQIRAEPGGWNPQTYEGHLSAFLKLLSRTFRPDQRAVVKATSFVSELAGEILARPCRPRAIFMTVSPENYLATILGAENSPREAQMLSDFRAKRLERRLATSVEPAKSLGEVVAMSWTSEMCALADALPRSRDRILWLDFDRFLAEPAKLLADCFRHLDIEVGEEEFTNIVSGPDMSRYSKAQEYDYDAQLRADVLAQARVLHGADISSGLKWLERTGAKHPLVAELLATVKGWSG